MTGGSGNILDTVGGDLTGSLTSLSDAVNNMRDFLDNGYTAKVSTSFTAMKTLTDNYYSGKVLDFTLA